MNDPGPANAARQKLEIPATIKKIKATRTEIFSEGQVNI
jgi:hypothetical protein